MAGVMRYGLFVVLVLLVSGFAVGQYPPATPDISRCTLFSTDREQSGQISISPSSYFVRVGAQPVLLHLEFTAFAAYGFIAKDAIVTVSGSGGPQAFAARPRMTAQDRFAVDLPITGLSQPYTLVINSRTKVLFGVFLPKC